MTRSRRREWGCSWAVPCSSWSRPTATDRCSEHLLEHGEGIRSTVFGVRDLDHARSYFAERGIELVPGTAPDTLAIPAEQHRGVIFEFAGPSKDA